METGRADPSQYREVPPPDALAAHVTTLWVRDVPPTAPAAVLVVPDGTADLMWLRDGSQLTTLVAGPDRGHQFAELAPGSVMAGLRFTPGAAAAVLGVPMEAVLDQRVPLRELWGPAADEVAERAAEADRPELVLAETVQQRIDGPPDATAGAIARTLGHADGPGVVAQLADELGLSERQLQRRCRVAFEYEPKTLHRVLRFQRALRLARAGGRLADVAAVAGYADQAHLARETRQLSGVPITQLL